MKRITESDLQREILKALALSGAWAMRLNAGLTVLGEGKTRRVIRGAPPGTPDILVLDPTKMASGFPWPGKRGLKKGAK